jgi:hypothetical protein
MKFGWLILKLHVVDLKSTGEIKITSGIKFTSMISKLPCVNYKFGAWTQNHVDMTYLGLVFQHFMEYANGIKSRPIMEYPTL